jgi:hypothetical protein
LLGASSDHFTGCPSERSPCDRSVSLERAGERRGEVELVGFNLPTDRRVKIQATDPGELELPLSPEKFRSRRALN